MKILLADDHQLIRDGLRAMLSGLISCSPVFLEADSFAQAREQCQRHPDIALAIVDMRMSDATGATPFEAFARACGHTPMIVLSGFLQPETVRTLMALGPVHAVLSKGGDPQTLRYAVLETLAGRRLGDANRLLDGAPEAAGVTTPRLPTLAPRLQGIYALLCEGKSNKAIARELRLSEGTVKNYVSLIYKELDVHNRIEAAWRVTQPPDPGGA